MKTKKYNKLVRDNIPAIIKAAGAKGIFKKLNAKDFKKELRSKLVEEAKELKKAKGETSMLKELADLTEVRNALAAEYNITPRQIETERRKRQRTRGGFKKKLFLKKVMK
ncbi:MAG: nucleoside triphosphate pyrophosphohydrolase [Candidatus Komeilibacteria bacterium]|nr:nucleoside triphosphate pyrophosphohydrolase [Candidatus Komeilibacteria bacterium]